MKDTKPGPPTRTRNRRGEGALLREEIVSAAQGLLDDTGDERAITLRSIARRAGIAAPSIYPHFPDQPAIMLAVVRRAFDELADALRAARDSAPISPRERLFALGNAYLDFARSHPQRYRTMFGGLWIPSPDSSVTDEDLLSLGDESMRMFRDALADCVTAGQSTSTDPAVDAIALWLGLHGLAHQRAATRLAPAPEDIGNRMIPALAHMRSA